MSGPEELAGSAQRAAGVIAAVHRGDHDGAEALLASFGDPAAQARGFYLLAEVTLGLLRAESGQSMDEVIADLSLHLAAVDDPGSR